MKKAFLRITKAILLIFLIVYAGVTLQLFVSTIGILDDLASIYFAQLGSLLMSAGIVFVAWPEVKDD